MVYKKYVYYKGKRQGPYFYESVRQPNGKISAVYLGMKKPPQDQVREILAKKGFARQRSAQHSAAGKQKTASRIPHPAPRNWNFEKISSAGKYFVIPVLVAIAVAGILVFSALPTGFIALNGGADTGSVSVVFSPLDSSGQQIPVSVHAFNQSGAEVNTVSISPGIYDVQLGLRKGVVEEIFFKGANLAQSEVIYININDAAAEGNWTQGYSVGLGSVESDGADISATAKGTELYKCIEWNPVANKCFGEWQKIADITPGQKYSFSTERGNFGYAESLPLISPPSGMASLSAPQQQEQPPEPAAQGNQVFTGEPQVSVPVEDAGALGRGKEIISLKAERAHYALDESPKLKLNILGVQPPAQDNSSGGKGKGKLAVMSEPGAQEPKVSARIFFSGNGEEANPAIKINKISGGSYELDVQQPSRAFRAGRYRMLVDVEQDGVLYEQEQDFLWGVLALNTRKSFYLPNEQAFISMAVLDDAGRVVCDSEATLEITSPSGAKAVLSTLNGGIKISDECPVLGVTALPDYYAYYNVAGAGIYQLNLTAVTSNGVRSLQDQIIVQNAVDFDVARDGPTRIFPPSAYTMSFTIKANKAHTGSITEYVPASFDILPQTGMSEKIVGDAKKLTWSKNLQAGQTYQLSYTFDAPDISPELFTLGKLEIGTWTESRDWMIASDQINVGNNGTWVYVDIAGRHRPDFRTQTYYPNVVGNYGAETAAYAVDPDPANKSAITYIRIKACPTRDEKLVAYMSNATGRFFVATCNGRCDAAADWTLQKNSSLISDKQVCTTAAGDCDQTFDIAYEQIGGRAFVVWGNGSNLAPGGLGILTYDLWNNSSWMGDQVVNYTKGIWGTTAVASATRSVRAVADGEQLTENRSNYIMVVWEDNLSRLYAAVWNGTNLTALSAISGIATAAAATRNVSIANRRPFDAAWETGTGNAVIVYGNGTANTVTPFAYVNYTRATNTFSTPQVVHGAWTTNSTVGNWVELASDPQSDRIAAALSSHRTATLASAMIMPAIWKSDTTISNWTLGKNDTSLEDPMVQEVSVAWCKNCSTPRALFVACNGTALTTFVEYANWTTTLGFTHIELGKGVGIQATQDDCNSLQLFPSPNSNNITLGVIDIDGQLQVNRFAGDGGNSWLSAYSIMSTTMPPTGANANNERRSFSFAYTPYSPWAMNWRWTSDTTSAAPTSWLADEDKQPSGIAAGTSVRLRMNFAELGGMGINNTRFRMQFTTGDPNVTTATWTYVGEQGSAAIWKYCNGPGTDNEAIPSSVLNNTTTNGKGLGLFFEKASGKGFFNFTALQVTEFDFCIQENGATGSTNYYFRAYDEEQSLPIKILQSANPWNPCAARAGVATVASQCTYPALSVTADSTPPVPTVTAVGGDAASAWSTSDNTPYITMTLNENGDCYLSKSDQNYDDAQTGNWVDCGGDGGTAMTCQVTEVLADASTTLYAACKDTLSNKDTDITNEHIAVEIDTTPPQISSVTSVGGDTTTGLEGSYSTSDTTPVVIFEINEIGDCRASADDGDEAYAAMDVDCTGDGTTTMTCDFTGNAVTQNNPASIYIGCRDDTDATNNADTDATNEIILSVVDATAPQISSVTSVGGDTTTCCGAENKYSTSDTTPVVILTINENGYCRASTDDGDESYASMSDNVDCTGDGTTSITCDFTGQAITPANPASIYFACGDYTNVSANVDSDTTNEVILSVVDATAPTVTIASIGGDTTVDPLESTYSTSDDTPVVTATTNENADCKAAIVDESYSAMADLGAGEYDCTGDGTQAHSCSFTSDIADSPPDRPFYVACADYTNVSSNQNSDSNNGQANAVVDTAAPTFTDDYSPAVTATSPQAVTFTIGENGYCKWSTTDQAYGDMGNDCTGDGTTSISCSVTLSEGANTRYFACGDYTNSTANVHSIATNDDFSITLDSTKPTITFVSLTPHNETLSYPTAWVAANVTLNEAGADANAEFCIGLTCTNYSMVQQEISNQKWFYNMTTSTGTNYTLRVYANDTMLNLGKSRERWVLYNTRPSQGVPWLNSTLGLNKTAENITCTNFTTSDSDSKTDVTNIYKWYINGTSLMSFYTPFENQSSGTGLNATVDYGNNTLCTFETGTGGPAWTNAGKVGGAFLFDGSNDNINCSNTSSLDADAKNNKISVALWFKPTSTINSGSGQRGLISRNFGPYFVFNPPGVVSATGKLGFMLYQRLSGSRIMVVNSTTTSWTAGTWYHVAGTFDGTSQKIYIDGALQGTLTQSVNMRQGDTRLYIGNFTSNFFPGTIDDVRIYNRSLSANQVRALYEETNTGLSKNATLVADELTHTDQWTCEITPSDNFTDGLPVNSSTMIVYEGVGPRVTLIAPTPNNETVNATVWVYINATINEPGTGADAEFCVGASCTNFTMVQVEDSNQKWGYNRTSGLVAGTNYTLNVYANDTPLDGAANTGRSGRWFYYNAPPTQSAPSLASSSGTSTKNDNLTCTNVSTADADSTTVTNAFNWYVNGSSIMGLYLPFENQTKVGSAGILNATKDYARGSFCTLPTAVGGPTWTNAGMVGGAYTFDGVDDFINCSNASWNWYDGNAKNNQISLAAWFKPSSTINSGSGVKEIIARQFGPYFIFNQNDATGKLGFLLYKRSATAGGYSVNSTTTSWTAGTWYHAVGTFNGTHMSMYIDGVRQSTFSTVSYNMREGTSQLTIGGYDGGAYFPGTIDDVRIYNRTLSEMQVAQLYSETSQGYSNASIILQNETRVEDAWTCEVTPNDNYTDGPIMNSSSTLTIIAADLAPPVPTITGVGGDAASAWSTSDNTPIVTADLNEDGDCRFSTDDLSYDGMAGSACSNTDSNTVSCQFGELADDPAKTIYIACKDTVWGNKDTVGTNEHITVEIDTAPPVPTVTGVGGDAVSAWSTSDNTPAVTADLSENGNCRFSTDDLSYDDMAGSACSNDDANSVTCQFGELADNGAKTVYVACADDTDASPNEDTVGTNEHITVEIDTTPPQIGSITSVGGDTTACCGADSPNKYSTSDTTPVVIFEINEVGDCRASADDGDEAYGDMDVDCTGDGGTTMTCDFTGNAISQNNPASIYVACRDDTDATNNADTAGTNEIVYSVVDAAAPTFNDDYSPTGTVTSSPQAVTFTIGENGYCRASTDGDEAYTPGMDDDVDCTGDGTTSMSCSVPLAEGANNIYFACGDYTNSTANTNSAANNGGPLSLTLDTTPPQISSVTSVGGDTTACCGADSPNKYSTSDTTPVVVFVINEVGDCRASADDGDEAYGDMDVDCTGDGGTTMTCDFTGNAVTQNNPASIYVGCRDSLLNADTAGTNEIVYSVVDAAAPTFNDDYSPALTATSPQAVTFTIGETGYCKWSEADQAYGDMGNDCTGDGTTSISCSVTLSEGANTRYFACGDYTNSTANVHSDATNDDFSITLDITGPTITFRPEATVDAFYNQTWVYVNVTLNEAGANANFELGNTNYSMTQEEISNQKWGYNVTSVLPGNYTATVYANDTLLNLGKSSIKWVVADLMPTHGTPWLNSTLYGAAGSTNTTDENITCYNWTTVDGNGADATNIFNWYVNQTPLMLLNMPFDTNLSSLNANLTSDYTNQQNNGTLGNGTAANRPKWIQGKIGGAYDFDGASDGSGDFVRISSDASLNPTDSITLAAWVKVDGSVGTGATIKPIIIKEVTGFANPFYQYALYAQNHGGTTNAAGFVIAVGGSMKAVAASETLPPGEWAHVVGTYDGTDLRLYVNGSQVNTNLNQPGTLSTYISSVVIGAFDYAQTKTSSYSIDAKIDDVRIYNRSLTADQVAQLYNETRKGWYNSTISYSETRVDDTWTCELTPNDNLSDGTTRNSSTMTILSSNTAPTAPTPFSQFGSGNNTITTNRRPVLMWINSTDTENDEMTYEVQVDTVPFANTPIFDVSGLYNDTDTNSDKTDYTPSSEVDPDVSYAWRVRAYDGELYSDWSTIWEFELQSSIDVAMIGSTVAFSSMSGGETKSTVDTNSLGFLVIENRGNCDIDLSIKGGNLWASDPNPTSNFVFKTVPNQTGAYTTGTADWTSVPTLAAPLENAVTYQKHNNYTNLNKNRTSVHFQATVPYTEVAGSKSSEVTLTAEKS